MIQIALFRVDVIITVVINEVSDKSSINRNSSLFEKQTLGIKNKFKINWFTTRSGVKDIRYLNKIDEEINICHKFLYEID